MIPLTKRLFKTTNFVVLFEFSHGMCFSFNVMTWAKSLRLIPMIKYGLYGTNVSYIILCLSYVIYDQFLTD